MGQDTDSAAINLGEVFDQLGITVPTTEETETAPDPTPEQTDQPEAAEETDTTESEDSAEETPDAQSDEPDDSEESDPEEPKDEDADEAEAPEADAEKSVKKLNKRVDKLTARAKSAEEQATALQAELAQTKEALAKAQPIVLQDTADPLADVLTPADLDARVASASTVLDQVPDLIAKAEMEGGEVEVSMGNGATQKFTSAQLRERLQLAKTIVRSEPQRRAYFAQRESYVAEARQVYPELFEDGSASRQLLTQTIRQYPGLSRLPNLEMVVGDALLGQRIRFGELKVIPATQAATTQTKPKAAAPAKPAVAPKVPQPSAAPRQKSSPNALEALRKSGSREAAESFVAALLDD